jgi:putative membrane protein
MPPAHHSALEPWWSSGVLILILVVVAVIYMRGWRNLRAFSANVIPIWRACSFFLGLFLIWVALGSSLAAYDHELLTVHMIQHLLLMTFAPAMILLGEPVKSIVHGLPEPVQVLLDLLCRTPLTRRAGSLITRPALCWLAAGITLIGWHVPAMLALGLQSDSWHTVEHSSFLGAGFLFWWPVARPWPSAPSSPRWSILVYLFLATLPCDILSGFLVFSERVVYPIYLLAPRRFGMAVLEDQQCAAALMWTCITIVYLVPAAILTTRLLGVRNLSSKEMAQSDLRGIAAIPADPQRAGAVEGWPANQFSPRLMCRSSTAAVPGRVSYRPTGCSRNRK